MIPCSVLLHPYCSSQIRRVCAGASRPEETVDAVQDRVGSEAKGPLLDALHVVHGHLHFGGPPLYVPPGRQQRTLERAPPGRL